MEIQQMRNEIDAWERVEQDEAKPPLSVNNPTSFRFSPHTAAQLKALCECMGLERQAVVSMAIDRMAVTVLTTRQPAQVEPEGEREGVTQ